MDTAFYISTYCSIRKNAISLNGKKIFQCKNENFENFIRNAYHHIKVEYPKFFKMDSLSKLAFLSAEVIFSEMKLEEKQNTALFFANSSASLDTDIKHQKSIKNPENYYPSPSIFVYTLPNICLGEISIRHQLLTENAFFVFDAFPPSFFHSYSEILLKTNKAEKVLCGWVDLLNDNYCAFLYLVEQNSGIEHTTENIKHIFNL